jgi:hypothetical protein
MVNLPVKKTTRKTPEMQMYLAVKAYLKDVRGCKHVSADEGGQKIHLPRNLSKRDPDVVGVTEDNEVHIAEGKCLARSGQPFEQCVEQALSLGAFADYLYVFFPWEEWSSLRHDDDQRNKKILRDKGIGLLLVDKADKCREILPSRQNTEVESQKRDQIRKQMGILQEPDVPKLNCLSSPEASNARAILDCFNERGMAIAGAAIFNVFKEKVREWKYHVSNENAASQVFYFYPNFSLEISIDLDVFGGYLRDGHSCMWVTREVSRATLLQRLEARSSDFGTHLHFGEQGFVPSLTDINPEQIRKTTDQKTFWLMHRVEFFGRSRDGLRIELESLLAAAKKLK